MQNPLDYTQRQLLLLSSSKVGDTEYLAHSKQWIKEHFLSVKEIVFIPYAGVLMSHQDYTRKVQDALGCVGISIRDIESFPSPRAAIQNAEGVMVGGGNTFALLATLYRNDLLKHLQERILQGMPYAGWSAGANIAGPSIRTTNDMPIVEPESFAALYVVPFQLNPHYIDQHPPGFHGETRAHRLTEFMQVNPGISIIALREGTGLHIHGNKTQLLGPHDALLFKEGTKHVIPAASTIMSDII